MLLGTGCWKLEVGSWKLEVGIWIKRIYKVMHFFGQEFKIILHLLLSFHPSILVILVQGIHFAMFPPDFIRFGN